MRKPAKKAVKKPAKKAKKAKRKPAKKTVSKSKTLSDSKKRAFLEALGRSGNVTVAAHAADYERKYVYQLRKNDPDFAEAWEDKLEMAGEVLEAEARKRAFNGSDTLLIFLLKGAIPLKYADRKMIAAQIEHKGPAVEFTKGTAELQEILDRVPNALPLPSQNGTSR